MKLFPGSLRTLPGLMASTILLLAMTVPCRAQCAMCEGSAAAGGDGGAVYNRSTLFMLSVPYLLLLGVGGYVVYAFRRARSHPRPGSDDAPAPPEPKRS